MLKIYTFKQLEDFAKKHIFPILLTGNPTWDKPHAQAAVFHINNILQENPKYNLDPLVMILAAYLHDIGYSKFYKKEGILSKDEYMEAKKSHMDTGVKLASMLLSRIEITADQRKQILHLVSCHDKIEELKTDAELILMEADTLAGLDVNFVTPSFTYDEDIKYMESTKTRRYPKFITSYAKNTYQKLYAQRRKYYESSVK